MFVLLCCGIPQKVLKHPFREDKWWGEEKAVKLYADT